MTTDSILWRRLDAPGHDACRLDRSDNGWELRGTAVFREAGMPVAIDYQVACDDAWHKQRGRIHGWIGTRSMQFTVMRSLAGVWTLNGNEVAGLESCVDLDFGFTPATNLLHLRRLALEPRQAAGTVAAWLDAVAGTLEGLPQRYERRSASSYWYESPTFEYTALLEVRPSGFIRSHPGLWEEED